MNAIILANGEFPKNEEALKALTTAHHLVCCDGAAEKLLASGLREPDIVIGDFDSLSGKLKNTLNGSRLIQVTEQETNDLQKAFRYCLAQGWRNILILGASGAREDHALGNIALLADFSMTCPTIRMMSDFGEFRCVSGKQTISARPGQQISIFSFDAQQQISSVGLKYPLQRARLHSLWCGTLNECEGNSFEITVEDGTRPVLVYLAF